MGRLLVAILAIAWPLHVFALVPSDPLYSRQWYLEKIGAPAAWDVTTGSPVTVAVLDVGVDLDHPDLQSALWTNPGEVAGNGRDDDANGYVDDVHGWDFVAGDADPSPSYDIPDSDLRDLHHGTVVAGIIAARGNNGEGIAGISWRAQIMPLRVLHSDGSGDVDTVLAAFRYAVAKGAAVINLSFVGDERATEFDAAIADATARGVVVVAAGGNEDRTGQGDLDRFPVYPMCAGLDGATVLGVAATNARDEKSAFSSYGRCVDLAAPGEQIIGTLFHDPNQLIVKVRTGTVAMFMTPYGGPFSGTSFAAPIAAGAAALLKGILPTAAPAEIIELLRRTADPIANETHVTAGKLGAGRLNLARAVAEANGRAATTLSAAATTVRLSAPIASVGDDLAVTVEARSASGAPLAGRTVELAAGDPALTIAPTSAVTDVAGIARFTLRARQEGAFEFTVRVDGAAIAAGRAVFAAASRAPFSSGALLRGSGPTVYAVGSDGKRYAFPDTQTFRSWYPDAVGIERVPDAILSAFPLGGLVTIRPGTFLVKIQTDPKVYAVETTDRAQIGDGSRTDGATLRWIASEEVASAIYGVGWAKRIVDVPDVFFTTYRVGTPLTTAHPTGMLLEDARDGNRYLIANGQRRRIETTLAFLKNGFQWRDVIRMSAVSYPDGTPIVEREVGLAQPVP